MTTKAKILQTALTLFNDTNTQAATTNHIAKAMNISAGNLHYHYKNREEIIRLLYQQMRNKLTLKVEELPKTVAELARHFEVIASVSWEYRFFQRELLFLLSRDPILEKRYIEDNIAHKQRIIQGYKNFIASGDMMVPYENILDHLADATLMHLQFWNPLMVTLGKELNRETFDEGLLRMQELLRPYLTPQALQSLAQFEG